MVGNVVIGIVIAALVCTGIMLASWATKPAGHRNVSNGTIASATILGILVGAAWICTQMVAGTKLVFLAPIALAAVGCITVGLIVMWVRIGAELFELAPFVGLYVLLYFVTRRCARTTATMIGNEFWKSLIVAIPILLLLIAIGISLIDMLKYQYHRCNDEDKNGILVALVLVAALLIGTVACIVAFGIKWGALMTPAAAEASTQETSTASTAEVSSEATLDATASSEVDDSSASATASFDEDLEAAMLAMMGDMETMGAMENMSLDEALAGVAESEDMSYASEGARAMAAWYKFYNLDLQLDADPLNDFNFGPNPFKEGLSAEDFRKEFYNRMYEDPAFAAGALAWLDANVGTRYLGEFYQSCKGDWAKTINLTKGKFMTDQAFCYQTVQAAVKFFDTATVKLEYRTEGLDDQMYMNPFTPNGVPDVIVMTTKDHGGYFLTFEFRIKADQAKAVDQPTVSYRIDCGYQPTDVEKVMNIKPDDTPRTENPGHSTPRRSGGKDSEPKSNPGGKDDPTPSEDKGKKREDPKPSDVPEPEDDEPDEPEDPEPWEDDTPEEEYEDPTPKDVYIKDPTKGTQGDVVKPNDDPGPGPDTNNGEGAQYSTKDQTENSNHMTLDDYIEAIEDLEEINQEQRTGEDPSIPSTTGPADTEIDIDDNADRGNGGAPINTPTEVSEKITIRDDPISEGMIGVPD